MIAYIIASYAYMFFLLGNMVTGPATAVSNIPLQTTKDGPKEVPVLCYHQVRAWTTKDSKASIPYIISTKRFAAHMQMLRDSGYYVILPGDYLDYMAGKKELPGKPVLITFDDGTISQWENALPILERHGMKAVFFIMTVTIGKPGYMEGRQIKTLHDKGHIIGCHTWDHHKVTEYTADDWNKQLTVPTKKLEELTQAPIEYFAYPYGVWDKTAIAALKQHGYKAAFQLSNKKDPANELFTLRRIIADGRWNADDLDAAIKRSFH